MLHKSFYRRSVFFFLMVLGLSSCIINDNIKDTSVIIDPGNDPNFTIVVNKDTGFESFNRKVEVFNIPIYAFTSVEDAKLLHVANILAQFLDNDEDGVVDNLIVHGDLKANSTFLFVWSTELERDSFVAPNGTNGMHISNNNINLIWHSNGHTGTFDNTIETVWTLITTFGYEFTYPAIFGNQANSELALAMDDARGGNFQNPPATYPVNAWYTNTEVTCNYACQLTKYNYWVMSSILGAHENRLTDIENEWKLNTSAKVQSDDVKAWTIYSNTNYNLPSVLPDGTYKH